MSETLSGAVSPSPFYDYWAQRSVANAWVQSGHHTAPERLASVSEEVAAFGTSAAFADISSRMVATISGTDLIPFLSLISGEADDRFRDGETRKIIWSGADGYARGSGAVAIRAATEAILVSAVSDRAWLMAAGAAFDLRFEFDNAAGLRVAGPAFAEILARAGGEEGPSCTMVFPGMGDTLILKTEPGFADLWTGVEHATALAWLLERNGARPAGRSALSAWKVAAGLMSPGVDWTPAQWCLAADQRRTPGQLTGGAYVRVGWTGQAPLDVPGTVTWPALGLQCAIVWAPISPGKAQSPPGGATILGPAATD
jgi:glycine cleavage system aminomethyltransferase T